MATQNTLHDPSVTPRLQQDNQEREANTSRAIGLFLLALVVLMLAFGAYYFSTYESTDMTTDSGMGTISQTSGSTVDNASGTATQTAPQQ